jgi:hypothetical protein
MRKNRPKHGELSPLQRLKSNARAYANVYYRRGSLAKKPCVVCASDNSQKHHEDYTKPLEVIWMCRTCHLEYHKQKELKPAKVA